MPHTHPDNAPAQKRVLNLKAVAIIACCAALFHVVSGWVHARQIQQTSRYLRESADQALVDEDPHRAFDLYEQYLAINPGVHDVEEIVADLLEEHGTSARALVRAFRINERLLLHDKSRDDLRLRQIRIAERLGRYSDASVHLKHLRDKRVDLSEVWHFSGIVARDTGNFAEAIEYFETAIELDNPAPESFEFLAALKTREQHDPEAAIALLDRMVSEYDSPHARRIRAAWYIDQQQPERAIPDLWRALSEEPGHLQTNALLVKSVRLARAADHQFNSDQQYLSLIVHLRRVLEAEPDQHRLRMYLSSALWATDQRDDAIENLEYGVTRDPRQFEMQEVLVDYLVSDRRFDRAQEVFDNIPIRVVERGRREFMHGRLLMAQRKWTDAINSFEMSIGYAHDDPEISSRARVCLALCRRETGDNVAAMDAYRSLIQADPDFEGGRLGMASAYLRADQISLAIAEYRQLLHVDGVPAFLGNLMIRHILSQPPATRDWSEVEDLLRDRNPFVTDDVQRVLLQADLLFAQGYPSRAMDKLDYAARRMPDREEIQRAYQRMSTVHGDSLLERVNRLLAEDPRNLEGHVSMLRLLVARGEPSSLHNWFRRVQNPVEFPALASAERLKLIAESATAVVESEIATRGQSPVADVLLDTAEAAWRQLTETSDLFLHDYVRFVAANRSVTDAITIVEQHDQADAQLRALCWLACLQYGYDQQPVAVHVNNELVELIREHPRDMSLRLAYAENRILLGEYDDAEQWLQQVADFDQSNGHAPGRLAWIALMIRGDAEKGLELANEALRRAGNDPEVRSIRGLALAENGQPTEGLEVLRAIRSQDRSISSHLFECRALMLAGQTLEAAELVRDISYRPSRLRLGQPETDLLRRLQHELQVRPPRMTRLER